MQTIEVSSHGYVHIVTTPTPEHSLSFDGLEIAWDRRILEPRAWTARQSQWAEQLLTDAPEGDVLELCSGAGHIGLRAIKGNDRQLVMVDIDPIACAFARRNTIAAGMQNRVEIRESTLDSSVESDEQFALIIADPPWVTSTGTTEFPEDPLLAIDGGDDGLLVARACVDLAANHLLAGASLLIQLGSIGQAEVLCADSQFELTSVLTEAGRGVVAHLIRHQPDSPDAEGGTAS